MAHAGWTSRNILIALLSIVQLNSCSEGVVTFTGGTATVRVFNAQTKTGQIKLYADSAEVITALPDGTLSSEFSIPSGRYVLFEAFSQDSPRIRLAAQRYVMADKQSYTLVIRGASITDFFRPIVDTLVSPFSGRAAIKIINASEDAYIQVLANGETVGVPVVDAQTILPFVPIEGGQYTISIGDVDTQQKVGNDSTVVLKPGECYYLFVFDYRSGSQVAQRWFIRKVN
ncbi:MAG: hypothetical protein RMK00_01900 [Bacteroidota bacterium]|nr:hypothetical protein [Bacteroidota bacterium]